MIMDAATDKDSTGGILYRRSIIRNNKGHLFVYSRKSSSSSRPSKLKLSWSVLLTLIAQLIMVFTMNTKLVTDAFTFVALRANDNVNVHHYGRTRNKGDNYHPRQMSQGAPFRVPRFHNHQDENSYPNHVLYKKNHHHFEPQSIEIDRRETLLSLLLTATASSSSIQLLKPQAASATTINTTTDSTPSITTTTTTSSINSPSIIIPPLDNRTYSSFTLPNGLRILLCSDPSSTRSAIAMNVHVGAASDPLSIPGMAHFTEHMLFLGTKSYPQEGSFENFLSANGGSSNAFTDSEDTVYYYTMDSESKDKLQESFQRFGSFFTSPLFTESATMRELNAIESENAKNLQSDIFRMYQIDKSRANTLHPFSKFYTGNKSTLLDGTKQQKIDLRTELIKFWSVYYSASLMSLAVVAPQPISVLKSMVVESFKDIPNTELFPPPTVSSTTSVSNDAGGETNTQLKPENKWIGKIIPYDKNNPKRNSIIPAQGHFVEIVPVADIRQLILKFPITFSSTSNKNGANEFPLSKTEENYYKPVYYISHLIGHEGPGSLASYLKKKGWVNSLGASTDDTLSDFYMFELSLELTSKAVTSPTIVNDIISTIFSYINMLRSKPIPSYIFEEVLQLDELEWRFMTKGDPSSYVQSLVKGMQEYPPELYVAGPRRLALFQDDDDTNKKGSDGNSLIDSNVPRSTFSSNHQLQKTIQSTSHFLTYLTPDNALFTILSKSFEGKTNKVEKWYGTKYNVKPIPSSTLNIWTNNPPNANSIGLAYPLPNVFIPSEEGLKVKRPVKNMNNDNDTVSFEARMKPIPPPRIIRDDNDSTEGGRRWTVYFKEDDRFGLPKSYAIVQLLTKQVYSSPMQASLATFYQLCAFDKLQEYTYDAALAGLAFDVQVLPRGVRLSFFGYNDKLIDFATYVSTKLSQDVQSILPENQAEFDRYKDRITRALLNFDIQQPYAHASYYSSLLFTPRYFTYTNDELRKAMSTVTLKDLTEYATTLWKSGKAEALLQGNWNEGDALQLVNILDKKLGFESISSDQLPPHLTALELPAGKVSGDPPSKIVVAEPNKSNNNAASHVTIQSLGMTEKDHVVIEILAAILNEPFYEDLRTKQQLGYIVSCGVKAIGETRNLSFVVQSSIASAENLTQKIFVFLDSVRSTFLESLTDDGVAVYAKGLLLKKTEPDKTLANEVTRNWNEIATGRMQFDRMQKESIALLNITKNDIVDFWDTIYVGSTSTAGGKRRVLVTEIIPNVGPASTKQPSSSSGYSSTLKSENPVLLGVDDVDAYRAERENMIS